MSVWLLTVFLWQMPGEKVVGEFHDRASCEAQLKKWDLDFAFARCYRVEKVM